MSYNGNGVFNINTAGQPVVAGTIISATAFNALTTDLANGLTTCLTKDGQTTPTANIPMGGFRITGLGAAVATTDAVNYQVFLNGNWTTTTAIKLPVGTTAQRPGSPTAGNIRYNSDLTAFEGYNGTSWSSIASGTNAQITSLGVGTAASGTTGEIRATNNVTAYFSSDRIFKENVKPVQNALEKVQAIGTKTFDWKDEYIKSKGGEDGYFVQKHDFGVIAQDVLAVFPQAVRTREDGTLAVDYEKLSTLAFQALIELTERVKALEVK